MSNEFSEKKKAADTSVPASAQNRGGGAIDSPLAKRVWRKPSIRVMPVGATAAGRRGNRTTEDSVYFLADCDNPFYVNVPGCTTS